MKLLINKSNRHGKSVKLSGSRSRISDEIPSESKGVINRLNVDEWLCYVGFRVRRSAVASACLGTAIPTLTKRAYIWIKGAKGILIHPIKWDGKDVYSRDEGPHGVLYGKISVLKACEPALVPEVLSLDDVLERARKFGQIKLMERQIDKKQHKVALLNTWGADYVGAVEVLPSGAMKLHNMEQTQTHNQPRVRYTLLKDVKENVTKYLAQIKRS